MRVRGKSKGSHSRSGMTVINPGFCQGLEICYLFVLCPRLLFLSSLTRIMRQRSHQRTAKMAGSIRLTCLATFIEHTHCAYQRIPLPGSGQLRCRWQWSRLPWLLIHAGFVARHLRVYNHDEGGRIQGKPHLVVGCCGPRPTPDQTDKGRNMRMGIGIGAP